ncbi:DEAD/DEAH box helicase [Propionibacterium sp.]|uniref:DEAD/DEAH box helicase n=1 Tax=Propionibacterium sp. TaxID=1977903 RepID=UPI0039E7F8C1
MRTSEPTPGAAEALAGFGTATRRWFTDVFDAPTPAQVAAWQAIGSGDNALVIAPTGSGKTLAAFLHSLDSLTRAGHDQPALVGAGKEPGPPAGVKILYISPLKALAVDVERNLRAPLRGIAATAERLGLPSPEVSVAVRSGDTPAADRRRLLSHPPDILITTPESLFLMLSSRVGSTLRELRTVIVDEVHALAGTKRGAHLMVSLQRLEAMSRHGGFQRIGLSATVRPADRVASFLGGRHAVRVISPGAEKTWDLQVMVPLDDMTELSAPPAEQEPGGSGQQKSMWPPIEREILDLVRQHRSTICFVNSRRLAERLTARLNELYAADLGAEFEPHPPPAQVMAQSATTHGLDGTEFPIIASAHHGSVSKQRRAQIESDLKSGRLPCVVATSSLELGIDMGSVDLVVQVQSPPSVSSGLQRVGRAGHQVGAVSQGFFFPTSRGDVLESAVISRRMSESAIEAVPLLRNPLDVLAQQLVSMCLDASPTSADLFAIIRDSDPFRELPRPVFDAVLDMLSGRYPSEDFAELRPRLVWDRTSDVLSARPGARRLVTTSGGTIPDRGLFGVFLVGEQTASGKHEPGRRVGELDEEMVYESRVGDVFTLGTSSWRIEDITASQVLVSPAPGQPGRLPFWKGDSPGRPVELGAALGQSVRELSGMPVSQATARLVGEGLDARAASNLLAYLDDQRQATGMLPNDRQIVVEHFHDEIGDWRICVHCALGAAVLQPWALVVEQRARQEYGVDVHATATNDGIIIQLPETDQTAPDSSLLEIAASEVETMVGEQVFGSALFAARFRECAARALLLPRRNPGQRSPLWQQRIKSAQLLQVAAGYRDFPIVVEAMRECLQDVFDLPSLVRLMEDIAARRVKLIDVETSQPSPFARNLLFGYVGEFVYDEDQPLAERRVAALSLDSGILAELLGRGGAQEILDATVAAQVEAELQCLAQDRTATSAEQLWEIVRTVGPLTEAECLMRSATRAPMTMPDDVDEGPTDAENGAREDQAAGSPHDRSAGNEHAGDGTADIAPAPETKAWIAELVASRRLARIRVAGVPMLCTDTDVGLLRDGVGIPVPPGMAAPPPRPAADAVHDITLRWVRHHAACTSTSLCRRFGLPQVEVQTALDHLTGAGTVIAGQILDRFGDSGAGDTGERGFAALTGDALATQYCHQQVLTLITRRTLAMLRHQVEAVDQQQFARFLDSWQQLSEPTTGTETGGTMHPPATLDDLLAVADQLAGYPIPASMLESVVLPARLPGYRAALLDEALATGELTWAGAGAIGSQDGWITLWPGEVQPAEPAGEAPLSSLAEHLLDRLTDGGAWRAIDLATPESSPDQVRNALWELAWAGLVTTDTFTTVRELATRGSLKRPARPRPRRRSMHRAKPRTQARTGALWSAVRHRSHDPALLLDALDLELARYGVLTRGSVLTEPQTPSFADAYRLLSRMEETGVVRRGYFVSGLGGAQFATPGAVDHLRQAPAAPTRLLAACDPANPYGAALEWPATNGHRPARKAGALVVLADGRPVLYLERGAHTLLTFADTSSDDISTALEMVGDAVDRGALSAVLIDRIDGQPALTTDMPAHTFTDSGFAMVPQGYKRRRRSS